MVELGNLTAQAVFVAPVLVVLVAGVLLAVVNLAFVAVHSTGIALLVAAVLAGAPPQPGPGRWTPPYPGPPPHQGPPQAAPSPHQGPPHPGPEPHGPEVTR